VSGERSLSIRAAAATSPFVVIIAIIAILARATAISTEASWFSPGISAQFYEITLLAASFLVLGLGSIAVARLGRFDTAIRELDLEIAAIRHAIRGATMNDDSSPGRSSSVEFVQHLQAIGIRTTESEKVGHDAMIDVSPEIREEASDDRTALWEELREQRAHLVSLRNHVWPIVIGPISLGILFVAISGTMLPGVEGFLVSNFHLNTALILLLAYSWWLLVTWTVFALATLPAETLERASPRTRLHDRYA